jgi:hypothetical protein
LVTRSVTDVVVTDGELRLDRIAGGWALAGAEVDRFALVNEYLSYLSDRNYSAQTVRVYGFSLLAFCRWLTSEEVDLEIVNTRRAAALSRRVPTGNRSWSTGPQCGAVGWSAGRRIRAGDSEQSSGRCFGIVRVPSHA